MAHLTNDTSPTGAIFIGEEEKKRTSVLMEKGKTMRLIDADALKTIRSIQSADYNSIETIQHWIDKAPTIEAVLVVRCKDCKFGELFQNDSSGVMARYCKAFTFEPMVADNDFCSYGERRGDEIDRRGCAD